MKDQHTIRCAGTNCCAADCTFEPKAGASVETEAGTLAIADVLLQHLRLAYGWQPRELWWHIRGTLKDKPVLCKLMCTKRVRQEHPVRLRPGDAGYYKPH